MGAGVVHHRRTTDGCLFRSDMVRVKRARPLPIQITNPMLYVMRTSTHTSMAAAVMYALSIVMSEIQISMQ